METEKNGALSLWLERGRGPRTVFERTLLGGEALDARVRVSWDNGWLYHVLDGNGATLAITPQGKACPTARVAKALGDVAAAVFYEVPLPTLHETWRQVQREIDAIEKYAGACLRDATCHCTVCMQYCDLWAEVDAIVDEVDVPETREEAIKACAEAGRRRAMLAKSTRWVREAGRILRGLSPSEGLPKCFVEEVRKEAANHPVLTVRG